MIFIGHGLLAQPDLVNLIEEDREDEIRPCIGCGHCIDHQLQHGARAVCSGNAVLEIGNRPDTSLYDSLKDEVKEIYNIGDSNGGGIIPNAVYEGYTVGNKI